MPRIELKNLLPDIVFCIAAFLRLIKKVTLALASRTIRNKLNHDKKSRKKDVVFELY